MRACEVEAGVDVHVGTSAELLKAQSIEGLALRLLGFGLQKEDLTPQREQGRKDKFTK